MAGPRIRTVKPEWLEDEQLLRAGSHARVLSVALILIADDYGRGRCIPEALAAQVFPFEQNFSRVFRESLASLSAMRFVGVYRVREQQYFELRNWRKHQRVDKPGKPRVPAPNPNDFIELEDSGESRESVANDSGESRESLAPDRDQDQDQDQDREGEPACVRTHAIPVLRRAGSATGSVSPSTTPPTVVSEESLPKSTSQPESLPSRRLWAIWQELTGGEASATPSKAHKALLADAWTQLQPRDAANPEGFWRRLLSAYIADERKRGRALELSFCVTDFDKWAELVARASLSGPARPEHRDFLFADEVKRT